MIAALLFAVPMAILWMIVSGDLSPGSFGVGYVLSFAILVMVKAEKVEVDRRKLPDQLKAVFIYVITLARDIWLSSIDVTKRVLNPELPMNPGLIAVPVQDETENDFTAAFSAHGITITPGELVVDFEGKHTMYVHCLDMDASEKNAQQAQRKRLTLLRRIQGR